MANCDGRNHQQSERQNQGAMDEGDLVYGWESRTSSQFISFELLVCLPRYNQLISVCISVRMPEEENSDTVCNVNTNITFIFV